MNILQFADYSAPYEGNFILSLKYLENKLTNHKTVYLFTKEAQKHEWTKKVPKVYFLTDNLICNIIIFKKIIKEENIDIIHTHFSLVKYDLALKIARLLSKKTIYIRHMHMIYKNNNSFILEKAKRLISNADVEIACSDVSYDAMISADIEKNKVFLVPNAIVFDRFDTYKNLGKTNTSILLFGYDYDIKGVDLAINAVKRLVSDGKKLKLQIILAKNNDINKEKIIADFGSIPEFIEFLTPRNDIATYYRNSDIFLSSSRKESFCYSIREAAYCECLVVASDIKAHSDVPSEFRFKSGDYLDLCKKLEFALNIDNKKEKIAFSKELVTKKYSIDIWSERILEIYNYSKKL